MRLGEADEWDILEAIEGNGKFQILSRFAWLHTELDAERAMTHYASPEPMVLLK